MSVCVGMNGYSVYRVNAWWGAGHKLRGEEKLEAFPDAGAPVPAFVWDACKGPEHWQVCVWVGNG